jgi:hypothetical protein
MQLYFRELLQNALLPLFDHANTTSSHLSLKAVEGQYHHQDGAPPTYGRCHPDPLLSDLTSQWALLLHRRHNAQVLLRGTGKGHPRSRYATVKYLLKAPPNALPGSYKAEAFNMETNTFHATSQLQIAITVDEVFDNDHRVVSQTSTSSNSMSKFTFSAADSGQHRLCFTPSGPAAISVGGWFSGAGASAGGVKLTVDLAIGETSKIESEDKSKIESIVGKVRELNGRLQDIRREQVFQRVCAPTTQPREIQY